VITVYQREIDLYRIARTQLGVDGQYIGILVDLPTVLFTYLDDRLS
jgi:hypothetical protein